MAVLKDLIVHGRSRFVNGIDADSIHANLIDANDGVFKTITTTTLDAETITTDMLKANNARVSQTLTVDGTISTNKWEAANIANIGGNFYISPTGKADSGTITVTKTGSVTINGVSVGTYTLVVGSASFEVTSTNSTVWGPTSGNQSKVIFTGSISYNNSKKYPLGTCNGTMTALSTGTNTLTGFTITSVNSPALDIFFQEVGVSSVSGTACNGYEMQISVYQTYYNSNLRPVGILLTSYGKEKKQYIDIYNGENALGDSASGFANPAVRIGLLDDLPNIVDGSTAAATKPGGWGIYTTNGFFKGKIVSNAGRIAGWNISDTALYNGSTGINNTTSGAYLGYATNNTGLNISGGSAATTITIANSNFTKSINGTSYTTLRVAIGSNFGMDSSGNIYANGANITNINAGNISAGNISADRLKTNVLSALQTNLTSANTKYLSAITADMGTITAGVIKHDTVGGTNGIWFSAATDTSSNVTVGNSGARKDWRLLVNNKFGVTTGGILYASGGSFNGRIEATEGYFASSVTIGSGGTSLSTVESNASQGVAAKNELDNMAWSSDVEKEPFLFRNSGGDTDHQFTAGTGNIVGGTVAWNQKLKLLVSGSGWQSNSSVCTLSMVDNVGTLTVTSASRNVYARITSLNIPANHVIFAAVDCKPSINTSMTRWSLRTSSNVDVGAKHLSCSANTWSNVAGVVKLSDVASGFYLYLDFASTVTMVVGDTLQFKNPQLFDLTQMFGPTIADYIYNLEQATAGAGVAWFKKLFNKPYYEYNTGELKSVEGLTSHDTVGFNAWDEEWEVGGLITGQINSKNYIPVLPSVKYYSPKGLTMYHYDASKILLSSVWHQYEFTMPDNCYYVKFRLPTAYGTIYNHDVCINISGDCNGEYEPYIKHSYSLDSTLTLRGVPKLDVDNKLYYDGDTYESDGTVTRKYGIVNLGELTWTYNSSGVFVSSTNASLHVMVNLKNAICMRYIYNGNANATSAATMAQNLSDKEICVYSNADNVNRFIVKDSSTTDANAFKASVSGVYLVYEFATPVIEKANPYSNPQLIDSYGTEEYVTTGLVPVGHETTYAYSPSGTGITADAYSSRYITAIDENGIWIHPQGNTSNYSKINSDGLEVYKDGSSVAAFGANTRIGQEGAGRIELDSKSISLIADTGLPALKSETSAIPITGTAHVAVNEELAANNTDSTRTLDLSYIQDGKTFYVLISSFANYVATYYTHEPKKKVVVDEKFGGASFEFIKQSSGSSQSLQRYVNIPYQIILFNSNSPEVLVNFQTITVTVDYYPPNTIRIRHSGFDPNIPDATYTYSGATIGITEASSKLKFDEIFCDKTVYIPKTQINGRCYFELNDDVSDGTNDKVADPIDYHISTILKNRGWDTDCLIEDSQGNTSLNVKALFDKIINTPLVIDDGTEDIWNYRKWSDGTAECWALNSGVYNITTAYGNAYYATYYAQTAFLFPSGLFVAEPCVNITRQGREGTGLVYCSPFTITKDRVDMFIANPGFQYPNAPIGYSIYAIGRWK